MSYKDYEEENFEIAVGEILRLINNLICQDCTTDADLLATWKLIVVTASARSRCYCAWLVPLSRDSRMPSINLSDLINAFAVRGRLSAHVDRGGEIVTVRFRLPVVAADKKKRYFHLRLSWYDNSWFDRQLVETVDLSGKSTAKSDEIKPSEELESDWLGMVQDNLVLAGRRATLSVLKRWSTKQLMEASAWAWLCTCLEVPKVDDEDAPKLPEPPDCVKRLPKIR